MFVKAINKKPHECGGLIRKLLDVNRFILNQPEETSDTI
jgi:hypothetical protein